MVISYSKWSTYVACPRKYKFSYIDGLRGPPSAAMSRGTMIHTSVEEFLQGKTETLHDAIHSHYVDFFKKLRDLGALPEATFAFTEDWTPTEFSDENASVRGIMDIMVPPQDGVLHIFELKTGKMYDDHVCQRHLYGTAGLTLYPDVEDVRVTGVYVDLKDNKVDRYGRVFHNYLKDTWSKRFTKMRADTDFPAMPGGACSRCPFSKDRGGQCEFGSIYVG